MQKVVNDLLHKEMSRKEFLRVLGVGLASLVGLSHLIKMLEGKDLKTQSGGYGSSTYGGNKHS